MSTLRQLAPSDSSESSTDLSHRVSVTSPTHARSAGSGDQGELDSPVTGVRPALDNLSVGNKVSERPSLSTSSL